MVRTLGVISLATLLAAVAAGQDVRPETLASWAGYGLRPVDESRQQGITSGEVESALSGARALAHERLRNYPDFLCEMVVGRFRSRVKPGRLRWSRSMGEIVTQVRVASGREEYRMLSIGGKRTKKSFFDLGDGKGRLATKGEFGTLLKVAFQPAVRFRWHGFVNANGKLAHKFRVTVPKGVGPQVHSGDRPGGPVEWDGFVYVDKDSEQVLAIVLRAVNIPWSYGVLKSYVSVFYGDVEIDRKPHLLPVASESIAILPDDQPIVRQSSRYRNYRKFEVESDLRFENVESKVSYSRR